VARTVEYLQGQLGDEAWQAGMHPDIPETKVLDNPYTYTTWDAGSAQWKGGAPRPAELTQRRFCRRRRVYTQWASVSLADPGRVGAADDGDRGLHQSDQPVPR
jgi:hypothetical protein